MKFIIWSPEYRHTSGGVETLHKLCHELNNLGQEAYVANNTTNPEWNTPSYAGSFEPETVVIYPEVATGNPYGASRVVRWVLNNPGYLGGTKQYDPSELVVYWPWFQLGAQKATTNTLTYDHELIVSFLDPNIFYIDDEIERTKYCYFPDGPKIYLPKKQENILIKDMTKEEVGKLLQESKVFYCFREDCALIAEALMCGTKVIYIDKNGNHINWDENVNKRLPYINYYKWTPEFWLTQWQNTKTVERFIKLCEMRWLKK